MVKNLNEFKDYSNYEELEHLANLLENWLSMYTESVIAKVMPRVNEILASEMAVNFLEELYEREQKEKQDRRYSMKYILERLAQGMETDSHIENFHNHCITHSKSYRDILYDMYIR